MITVDEVLLLHDLSIKFFGGKNGIRDLDSLKSAVGRAFQTFDQIDVYSSVFEKAAALLESIIKNHPFVDGNKRTGFLSAMIYLKRNNIKLETTETEVYEFVMKVASSEILFDEIVLWLQNNSKFVLWIKK